MKVKQLKKEDGVVTLEAVASAEEVNNALHAAKIMFAQQMGMKPPSDGYDIDKAAEEQMGIKDLDSIVKDSAFEALVPLALDKKDLVPLFPPAVKTNDTFKRNKDYKFELEVTLKPEYELTSYEPVEITVPPFAMNEDVVDMQLESMAERYTSFVDDPDAAKGKKVEKGDHIKIALYATENGEELKGLNTEGRTYTAGEGFMPDGFDSQIIGMKVGETKEFTFEGPDLDENMQERTQVVDCKVTVLGFEKPEKPVINDEWVKANMPMFKDLNGLKDNIRKGMEQQAKEEYDAYVRSLAAQNLSTRFEGSIPDEAYESMQQQLMQNIQYNLQQQGMTWEQFLEQNGGEQQLSMMLMLQVRQMLVQGFVLDAYFRHHNLTLTDEDILEACKAMNPQVNPEQMRKQALESGHGFALRESAERLKANKHLVENAKITISDGTAVEAAPTAEEASQN